MQYKKIIHRMPVEGLSSSQRFFIWMSHEKLPGVSALAVIANSAKSADLI
jgi:hypothetical protein